MTRSPILRDSLTAWSPRGDGWARTAYHGVRVELSDGASPGAAGSSMEDTLTAYLFGTCGLRVGDYVAPGNVASDEPPEGARRVTRISPWSLSGRDHHYEVGAR